MNDTTEKLNAAVTLAHAERVAAKKRRDDAEKALCDAQDALEAASATLSGAWRALTVHLTGSSSVF